MPTAMSSARRSSSGSGMKPEVTVCGVRDAAFAVAAAKLGVDYLGFIFEPSSPRHVTVSQATEIAASLGAGPRRRVRLVGVFVRESMDEIAAAMRRAGLDVVQLHRRATAEDVAALKSAGYEVWTLAGGAEGDGVLFDSTHGDGERELRRGAYRTILAGGVSAGNVAMAVATGPDVLDVNSSLETAPGIKSAARLEDFMRAFAAATVADNANGRE